MLLFLSLTVFFIRFSLLEKRSRGRLIRCCVCEAWRRKKRGGSLVSHFRFMKGESCHLFHSTCDLIWLTMLLSTTCKYYRDSFPWWMIVTFAGKAAVATTTTTSSKHSGGLAACSRLLQIHGAAAAASMQCGMWLFGIVGKPILTFVRPAFQTTMKIKLFETTSRGGHL